MNMSRTIWYLLRIPYGLLGLLTIGGKTMLEGLTEPGIAIGLSAVAVLALLSCVQYSKFAMHAKKHMKDDESAEKEITQKFAVIPYFVIPVMFGVLAVAAGLFIGDIVIGREYISGAEEITAFCMVASAVAYGILDYVFVSRIGDIAYFRMIESKLFQRAVDVGEVEKEEDDPETAKLKKKLQLLKELEIL